MKFIVEERSPAKDTGEPRFYVKVEMGRTWPEYAGNLTVCASPENMFRKAAAGSLLTSCLETPKPTIIAPEIEGGLQYY